MAECYYEPTPATDGATMNPVPGATFQVYEIADTTFSTPLSLRVGAGNPTTTVTASESLATLPGVYVTSPNYSHNWVSGSFVWRRDSIDGARLAIEDAKLAASNSASEAALSKQAAENAASLVDAPVDDAVETLVLGATKTAAALSATTASAIEAATNNPDGVIGTAIEGATSPANRYAEVGVQLGAMLGARPPLSNEQPTITYHSTTPAAGDTTVGAGLPDALTYVRFLGGVAVQPTDMTFGARIINGIVSTVYALEFDFTGQDLIMLARAFQNGPRIHLFVDGLPVTEKSVEVAGSGIGAGTSAHFRIIFGTSKRRRITVHMQGLEFRGIKKYTADTITPSTYIQARKRVAVLGDSWTGGALGITPIDTWPRKLGSILNLDVGNCGKGGTGYINPGPFAPDPFGSTARLDGIALWAPDYLIVFGSINDAGSSASTVGTAAAKLYTDMASKSPATKLIVIGPQQVGDVVPATSKANRDAIKAATVGKSNVLAFIDPIAQKVYTGTGRVDVKKGDGNADFLLGTDAVHPTALGHEYLASWVSAQVAPLTL